ncbi:MAG: hypothetical protein E7361_03775 [Clostridiales bacterium]|nr:hypothetical protein [Clostridiales bacterium]
MRTKHKIAVISIIAVLILAVIGMTIGLVLVAQQASLSNSMTISYSADNVDATIATNAKWFKADGTSVDIELKDSTDTTGSVEFDATDTTTTTGGFEYKDVALGVGDYVEYYFTITNTATPVKGEPATEDWSWVFSSPEADVYFDNSKILRVKADVVEKSANNNVKVSIGKDITDYYFTPDSYDEASGYGGSTHEHTISLVERNSEYETIQARDVLTLILRMEIDDPTLDANLEAGFNIALSYNNLSASAEPKSSFAFVVDQYVTEQTQETEISCTMEKISNGVTTLIDTKKVEMSTYFDFYPYGATYTSSLTNFNSLSMTAGEKLIITFNIDSDFSGRGLDSYYFQDKIKSNFSVRLGTSLNDLTTSLENITTTGNTIVIEVTCNTSADLNLSYSSYEEPKLYLTP